ncbi:CBM9 family sugar-binding protein [Alteromonas sp. IB21]|uniref:sugar-binding protein n=1 Tax=Alteromonas sp. IB21 TaxID=2779369 RepID=UPI0018E8A890|nr:sugar-binding protein [Alteromonas sp. IB21]MBJ2129436.1 CBM9 family sugar-binding protein [Alteromonas sp. IB21]
MKSTKSLVTAIAPALLVAMFVPLAIAKSDSVLFISTPPLIDGLATDAAWEGEDWHDMTSLMWGTSPEPNDFSGRYKLRWNDSALYLLAEIQDDHLSDTYANPLERYWDDDCLEIFIDADASGGDHLNNYNAFAYHLALDNQVIDIGPNEAGEAVPQRYNDHVMNKWQREALEPHKVYWEAAVRVFDDSYQHGKDNLPVILKEGMTLGFMLAYCDADGGDREHFLGSHEITPVNGDKNLGYKDASVFGKIVLTK